MERIQVESITYCSKEEQNTHSNGRKKSENRLIQSVYFILLIYIDENLVFL